MIWLIALFLLLVILIIVVPVWGVARAYEEPKEPRRVLGYDKYGKVIYEDTKGSRFDRWA